MDWGDVVSLTDEEDAVGGVDDVLSGERRLCLLRGDALEKLGALPDGSLDAMVTDPPAGIAFMGRDWDRDHGGREGWVKAFAAVFRECLRVLKPGAHALVWALPRTSHWTATALEDAGFEVRDVLTHHFGSGFPKSLDVGKAIDKRRVEDVEPVRAVCRHIRAAMDGKGVKSRHLVEHFGGCCPRLIDHWAARDTDSQPNLPTWEQWLVLREVLELGDEMDAEVWRLNGRKGTPGEAWDERGSTGVSQDRGGFAGERLGTAGNPTKDIPATDDARRWEGWGTALKPSTEHWILARRPLEGTVAANVLARGTGALNVDGCRVQIADGDDIYATNPHTRGGFGHAEAEVYGDSKGSDYELPAGRWPPNLLLTHAADCGEECAEGCPAREMNEQGAAGGVHGAGAARTGGASTEAKVYDASSYHVPTPANAMHRFGDSGGASRFFPRFRYQAKASRWERSAGLLEGEKNHHPTVKSVELMRWLCRLVTPPRGVVLDPFMGSGSTGVACVAEGFRFVGIEKERDYFRIAAARIVVVG